MENEKRDIFNVNDGVSLRLQNIVKVYGDGETAVTALKGISVNFRKSEFVSVLGQSGCGKTTMLNIIGGLDRYTSGDMLINGKSTKHFKDRDWDTYRNHSIGFVFQSYNLIPHQTVLQNVELALALSGVSKHERRERAKQALISVGLDTQFNKKPGEMSGGQMQRVAIARALVNNPDIILADEPTGALDSETSLQVMEILKEVAKDRLVIMVTHNPELAEKYSTRIVRMLDGEIIEDTRPLVVEEVEPVQEEIVESAAEAKDGKKAKKKKANKLKKPTMSIWTAFSLSLKNLFTKKGRTILTSFAGSIGIIGIALIYAVSQGMTSYVNHVQQTTLASYPLTLESRTMDLTSLMESLMNVGNSGSDHELDAIYKEPIITELVNSIGKSGTTQNDLKSFKVYLEEQIDTEGTDLYKAVTGVQYSYDIEPAIYTENISGNVIKSDTVELMSEMMAKFMLNGGMSSGGMADTSSTSSFMSQMLMGDGMWQELLPSLEDGVWVNPLITDQYQLVDGSWPNDYDEVVLIVNEKNEVDDLTLYALGLLSDEEIDGLIDAALGGVEAPDDGKKWSYDEIRKREYKTIIPAFQYTESVSGSGIYDHIMQDDMELGVLYDNPTASISLKIKGIIRPKVGADARILSTGIGYTAKLTEEIINRAKTAPVVQAQLANKNVDVTNGKPFKSTTGNDEDQKAAAFLEYVGGMTDVEKSETYITIKSLMTEQELMLAAGDKISADYPDNDGGNQALLNYIVNFIKAYTPNVDESIIRSAYESKSRTELLTVAMPLLAIEIQAQNRAIFASSHTDVAQNASDLNAELPTYEQAKLASLYDLIMDFSENSYDENMTAFGSLDISNPSGISLYTSSFENKDLIKSAIAKYNNINEDDETKRIQYTDYVGLIMSSVTTIINAITYVLIAFVSVSLVVSSIMIGVITLISVQERTKEIGILRALGASKRNVSSMFNAETLIIGFSSGTFGVLITYLLCIPINIILHALTGINTLSAFLPPLVGVILIAISMTLTLISGIIPSRSAAKKDPVVALRSE